MNPNAAHAVAVLEQLGWQRMHACGAVANMIEESNLNPGARGDYHHGAPTAFAICQWHEDRVAAIHAGCGIDVRTANLDEQIRAFNWEFRNRQPEAYEAVARSTSPFAAGYDVCAYFERPANLHTEGKIRGNLAAQLYAVLA